MNKIGTNEWLRIASTFHSLYAIAAEASPIRLPNNKNQGMLVYAFFASMFSLSLSIDIRCHPQTPLYTA
jgi:hypothetical protein